MPSKRLVMALLLFGVAWLPLSCRAEASEKIENNDKLTETVFGEDDFPGSLVNQTFSLLGQEFFRAFSGKWLEDYAASKISLAVYERPSARWGSMVWVEYRFNRVFQVFLTPGRSRIKEIAENAVSTIYQKILDEELDRANLFADPDMGKADY